MAKENLYTSIASVAGSMVMAVQIFPIDDSWKYLLTLISMTVAGIYTLKKQRLSEEVNKHAETLTKIIIGFMIFGAVGDLVVSSHLIKILGDLGKDIQPDGESIKKFRAIVGGIIIFVNGSSKLIFPSKEKEMIDDFKKQIGNIKNK